MNDFQRIVKSDWQNLWRWLGNVVCVFKTAEATHSSTQSDQLPIVQLKVDRSFKP